MAAGRERLGEFARSEVAPPDPPAARGRVRRRVLVADDNVYMAKALKLVLELWGFDVTVTHDGPAALAAAREVRPDVVLLDIKLPKLDGLQVARRLRREPDFAPRLLALTGSGDAEDRMMSLAAGFDEHLVKPVDPDLLRAMLQGREGEA
jgi:two-component system OmpR family response regulator